MRILVTGASGSIGGEVCKRLVERGHDVTALVHRRSVIAGVDGVPLDVAMLTGDITQYPIRVSCAPEVIVHAAALTAFHAPLAVLRRINFRGTTNVVMLANKCRAAVVHVSTAYVCGTRDGVVREGDVGDAFVNGYEASKAYAERMIRMSNKRWTIVRPSVVVGDSATGAIRDFENIYKVFRLLAHRRLRILPAARGATLDLVPIDHVAGGIVALAENMTEAAGKTVHLTAATPTPVAALGEAIGAVPGLGRPRFVDPAAFQASALSMRERIVFHAAAAVYTDYLRRAPVFDQTNARALVPPCPPTDSAWLDRLIGHCLDRGFVSARRDSDAPVLSV